MPEKPNDKIDPRGMILDLIKQCDEGMKDIDERLSEIYKQYDVPTIDVADMAIVGQHVNKTAELKIKAVGEKAKLAELLHKMTSADAELEIAKMMALQQIDGNDMDDDPTAGLYDEEDDEDQNRIENEIAMEMYDESDPN